MENRYFPNKSFWEARSSSHSSPVWKSILSIKAPFYNNSLWLIGDGKSNNVAKDPWIHMNLNLDDRPLPPYISKVADLLVGHPPSWNAPLVRNLFHPSVTNLILKIQLHSSPSNVTDRQLWKPSKTGGFSVKSAYQVLLLERDKGSCSSSIGLRDLWKALWKYKGGILPRIKTFLWRCCFNDGMCNSQIPFTLD